MKGYSKGNAKKDFVRVKATKGNARKGFMKVKATKRSGCKTPRTISGLNVHITYHLITYSLNI